MASPTRQRLGWLAVAVPALGFVLGVSADHLGASQRINILAPPLLALLVWNLAVYLGLVLTALGSPARRSRGWAALLVRRSGVPEPADLARATAVLHAAAAALALGALLSLYLRGLAFEYRAGWDSTFLDAAAVQRLLAVVLGPAAWLSGLALPDADELARLRYSEGPGENAARWIHLQAITLAGVVLLPRTLLAVWSWRRAQSLAQARERNAVGIPVAVWPYSHHASADALRGLLRLLRHTLGPATTTHVAPVVPLGGEDQLAALPWPAPQEKRGQPALVLFHLAATPERENHGAFIDALSHRCGAPPWVLVDESAFKQRFSGADGAQRLQQRRAAWRALAQAHGCVAVCVDLLQPDLDAARRDWHATEAQAA